jgi:integrase
MRPLPKYLTQDELKRFFDAITSPRDRALFALIYHYGLRVDEATQLTIDDVNLKEHRIRIRCLKNGVGERNPSGATRPNPCERTSGSVMMWALISSLGGRAL